MTTHSARKGYSYPSAPNFELMTFPYFISDALPLEKILVKKIRKIMTIIISISTLRRMATLGIISSGIIAN